MVEYGHEEEVKTPFLFFTLNKPILLIDDDVSVQTFIYWCQKFLNGPLRTEDPLMPRQSFSRDLFSASHTDPLLHHHIYPFLIQHRE